VVLQLAVSDAAATLHALQAAGASVIFPLQEVLGERMARVRDPFGHLWVLRQRVEELDPGEIQRRRDELFRRFASQAEATTAGTRPNPVENKQRLSETGAPWQAPSARIHLLLGPVGAGKSTLALQIARSQGGVRLALDAWMATLFRPDRPAPGLVEWYVERAARCVEQIWALTRALVASGALRPTIGRAHRRARRAVPCLGVHGLERVAA